MRFQQKSRYTIRLSGGVLARPVEHDIDSVSEGRSLAQTIKADLAVIRDTTGREVALIEFRCSEERREMHGKEVEEAY